MKEIPSRAEPLLSLKAHLSRLKGQSFSLYDASWDGSAELAFCDDITLRVHGVIFNTIRDTVPSPTDCSIAGILDNTMKMWRDLAFSWFPALDIDQKYECSRGPSLATGISAVRDCRLVLLPWAEAPFSNRASQRRGPDGI